MKKTAWLTEVESRVLDLGQGIRFSRSFERSERVRKADRLQFGGGGWEDIVSFSLG